MKSFIANKIIILSYNLQGSDRLCKIKLNYQVGFLRPRLTWEGGLVPSIRYYPFFILKKHIYIQGVQKSPKYLNIIPISNIV